MIVVRLQHWLATPLLIGGCALPVGCGKAQPKLAPAKPAEVLVSAPVTRSVADYEEFTGRTEAFRTVEMRSRVTGYLDRVNFKEGADIKQGDVLFEIDPRPARAEYERSAANVTQAEARYARVDSDYQRALSLNKTGAMSNEEFDKISGDRAEAAAAVRVASASRDAAKLTLDFTKIIAPISGRISRMMIDPGNLVKADETMLTSIVTQDPMYAYFDVDERTMLRLRRLRQAGKIRSARNSSIPVELGLTDEDGYSLNGTIDFVDNRIVANTGTLRLRGVFENPNGLLSPGLFVRIRMPVGDPFQAIMVSEQSVGTDQGQKFVYVVGDKNIVQPRKVKVGSLHDGMRVIEQGLAVGDRVVVSGLQRVRPGATVDPKPVEMPIVGANSATTDSAPVGGR
jgi:RND family efflux transporter MFP subunit